MSNTSGALQSDSNQSQPLCKDLFADFFKKSTNVRDYAKSFAYYVDRKTSIVREIITVLANVYANGLYKDGAATVIDEDVMSRDFWYTPIPAVLAEPLPSATGPVDIVYVSAIELARAISGKLGEPDGMYVPIDYDVADYTDTLQNYLITIEPEAKNVLDGIISSITVAFPFPMCISGAEDPITSYTLSTEDMNTPEVQEQLRSMIYRDVSAIPRFRVNVPRTLENIAGEVSSNTVLCTVYEQLGSLETVDPSTLRTALETRLQGAVNNAMDANADIITLACDAQASLEERIVSITEFINKTVDEAHGDKGQLNVDASDILVSVSKAEFTGTPASSMWNMACMDNAFGSALGICGKVLEVAGKIVVAALKAVWAGICKLWIRWIKPLYQSKDFVRSEEGTDENFVDIPIYQFVTSDGNPVPYDPKIMTELVANDIAGASRTQVSIPKQINCCLSVNSETGYVNLHPTLETSCREVYKDGRIQHTASEYIPDDFTYDRGNFNVVPSGVYRNLPMQLVQLYQYVDEAGDRHTTSRIEDLVDFVDSGLRYTQIEWVNDELSTDGNNTSKTVYGIGHTSNPKAAWSDYAYPLHVYTTSGKGTQSYNTEEFPAATFEVGVGISLIPIMTSDTQQAMLIIVQGSETMFLVNEFVTEAWLNSQYTRIPDTLCPGASNVISSRYNWEPDNMTPIEDQAIGMYPVIVNQEMDATAWSSWAGTVKLDLMMRTNSGNICNIMFNFECNGASGDITKKDKFSWTVKNAKMMTLEDHDTKMISATSDPIDTKLISIDRAPGFGIAGKVIKPTHDHHFDYVVHHQGEYKIINMYVTGGMCNLEPITDMSNAPFDGYRIYYKDLYGANFLGFTYDSDGQAYFRLNDTLITIPLSPTSEYIEKYSSITDTELMYQGWSVAGELVFKPNVATTSAFSYQYSLETRSLTSCVDTSPIIIVPDNKWYLLKGEDDPEGDGDGYADTSLNGLRDKCVEVLDMGDHYDLIFYTRKLDTMSQGALDALAQDINIPIDNGCACVSRYKFGAIQMIYNRDKGGLYGNVYASPISSKVYFTDNGDERIRYDGEQYYYFKGDAELTSLSVTSVSDLQQCVADHPDAFICINRDEFPSFFLSKLEEAYLVVDEYKDEAGDCQAYHDLYAAKYIWDIYFRLLRTPNAAIADLFAYSGYKWTTFTSCEWSPFDTSGSEPACSNENFYQLLTAGVMNEYVMMQNVYSYMFYVLSNKYSFMRIYALIFGTDKCPEFFPYLIGNSLGRARWHIKTDTEIQSAVDNMCRALIIAALVIAAVIICGTVAMKLKKALRAKALTRQQEVASMDWANQERTAERRGLTAANERLEKELKECDPNDIDRITAIKQQINSNKASIKSLTKTINSNSYKQMKAAKKANRLAKLCGGLGVPSPGASQAEAVLSEYFSENSNDDMNLYDPQPTLAEIDGSLVKLSTGQDNIRLDISNIDVPESGGVVDMSGVLSSIGSVLSKLDDVSAASRQSGPIDM